MPSLITDQSALAMWFNLVNQAEHKQKIYLNDTLESYLVFTLMRYITQSELTSKALGVEFLESFKYSESNQKSHLRNVGDKCLLVNGLFPQYVASLHLSETYLLQLGSLAYQHLAERFGDELYILLNQSFLHLTYVLRSVRYDEQTQTLTDSKHLLTSLHNYAVLPQRNLFN